MRIEIVSRLGVKTATGAWAPLRQPGVNTVVARIESRGAFEGGAVGSVVEERHCHYLPRALHGGGSAGHAEQQQGQARQPRAAGG